MKKGSHSSFSARPALLLLSWGIGFAWALVIGGCAQLAPTATPAPTPVPTPTPTVTPTATPSPKVRVGEFEADFNATPDAASLAQMLRLLSSAPADHDTLVFMDLAAMRQHQEIAESLRKNISILPPGMPPLLSGQLDRVVLATTGQGDGALVALEGVLTMDALLQFAANMGVVIAPEAETHREYEIWNGDLFGLVSVFLSEVDESTLLLSQENRALGDASSARLREALDSSDGLTPNAVEDPRTAVLVEGLPSGLITALSRDCSLLGVAARLELVGLPHCVGAGLAATLSADNILAVHILLRFDSEEQTRAGLETTGQLLRGISKSDSAIGEVALRREGRLLRGRLTGDAEEMIAALLSTLMEWGTTSQLAADGYDPAGDGKLARP